MKGWIYYSLSEIEPQKSMICYGEEFLGLNLMNQQWLKKESSWCCYAVEGGIMTADENTPREFPFHRAETQWTFIKLRWAAGHACRELSTKDNLANE